MYYNNIIYVHTTRTLRSSRVSFASPLSACSSAVILALANFKPVSRVLSYCTLYVITIIVSRYESETCSAVTDRPKPKGLIIKKSCRPDPGMRYLCDAAPYDRTYIYIYDDNNIMRYASADNIIMIINTTRPRDIGK